MTIPEILAELERIDDDVPYDAISAAVGQRDAIVPELIAAIERVTANPTRVCEDGSYVLHVHALYLLAQFREPLALPAIVRFLSLPGELPFDLAGEVPIAEHGAQILASVCGGDTAPLVALARAENVNSYVRAEAMQALALLAVWGGKPRAAIIASLRELFATLEKPGSDLAWAFLVETACCLNARELRKEIRAAFDAELVDESFIDRKFAEETFEGEGEGDYEHFAEHHKPVTDAAALIEEWECFNPDADGEDDSGGKFDDGDDIPGEPFIAPPKTGRNDLCPCGSGKKYKNCCATRHN